MLYKKQIIVISSLIIIIGSPLTIQAEVDRQASNFFKLFIQPGALVFDIGAHEGNKADLFINCGAHVICVEPQPACVTALKARFNNNGAVITVNKGVAALPGKMMMLICSQASTISTFSIDWTQSGRFASNFVWDKT